MCGEGCQEREIDTHTKPGGLFYDVYVDLIPQEEAESVCAFVSPTHGLDYPTPLPNTNSNNNQDSNKSSVTNKKNEKEKDRESSGTVALLNPSAFLSPVRTSSAGDIDCELRARLQVRTQLFLFIFNSQLTFCTIFMIDLSFFVLIVSHELKYSLICIALNVMNYVLKVHFSELLTVFVFIYFFPSLGN